MKSKQTLKGGTKSDEIKEKLKNTIMGTRNEHRKPVNEAIDKLKKTVGEEFVGPPLFKTKQKWSKKYETIKSAMNKIGEMKNDVALKKNGYLDNQLTSLKSKHDKLVVKNNQEAREVEKQLNVLKKPPTTIPGRGRGRGRGMSKGRGRSRGNSKINFGGAKKNYKQRKGSVKKPSKKKSSKHKSSKKDVKAIYHLPKDLLESGEKSVYHLPKDLLKSSDEAIYHLPKDLLKSGEESVYHLPKDLLDGGKRKKSKTIKMTKTMSDINKYYQGLK